MMNLQAAFVAHEAHQPAIVHRRDHAGAQLSSRAVNNRRLATRRVTASNLILVADTGLVTPENQRLFALGPAGKPGILLVQPTGDCRITALRGARQRLLRREAPAG
jgi:hypothetical protein